MKSFLDITGVQYLWNKVKAYVANAVKTHVTDKLGVSNGIATLGEDSKLASDQLPEFKTINGNSVIGSGDIKIDLSLYRLVTSLPEDESTIDVTKIYLVDNHSNSEGNVYNEYMYIDGNWELIGEFRSEVDLTDYVKKTDLASATEDGLLSKDGFTKLQSIESGAKVNVQSDWAENDETSDAYIKNKPTLSTVATTGSYDDLTGTPESITEAELDTILV